MSIYKFLIATTFMFVTALLVGGLYYQDSFAMNLADTSLNFAVLRAILGVLLIGLLVTNPPRSLPLRSIVGFTSILLVVMSVYLVMNFQMFLLDAVMFLQVAIIFGIEALETRRTVIPVREKRSAVQKIPVYTT